MTLAGATFLALLLAVLAWQTAFHSIDFPVYHGTAARVLAGDYEIYPVEVYGGGRPMPGHNFRYTPVMAFLFVPLALVPLPVAAVAFYLAKLAALVYIARTILTRAGVASHIRAVTLLSLFIVAGYAVEELRFGNAQILSMALMIFAFNAVEERRVVAPAAALGIAIAMKMTPAVLLGYFALRRRVLVCLATIAALVLLAAAPAAVVGWQQNVRLLRGFWTYALQKIDETENYSLRGVLQRYMPQEATADVLPSRGGTSTVIAAKAAEAPTTGETLPFSTAVTSTWIALVALLGAGVLTVLWRQPTTEMARLLELSVVLTAMILASPHTQRRYFVTLYVPALVLCALWLAERSEAIRRPIAVGLVATAAAGTLLPMVFAGRTLAKAYESASPYFFATVVLFAALLTITWRVKGQPSSSAK